MNVYALEKRDTELVKDLLDSVTAEFVGQPGYYTLVALDEDDNKPLGVIQSYVGTHEEYGISGKITYVFVAPDERQNEVGSELMIEMLRIFKSAGISVCEVKIRQSDETEEIKYAFTSFGFVFDEKNEYPYYEIPVGDIVNFPALPEIKSDFVSPLNLINGNQFRYLLGEIKRHDSNDILTDEMSLSLNDWELDVSCFFLSSSGCGAFLMRKCAEGILEPRYLCAFGRDASHSILALISYGARAVGQKYSPDTKLLIQAKKENVIELMKKLHPGMTTKKMLVGRIEI